MDFIENLKVFQNYLEKNNIDFFLVFSNNEFLKECSDLNNNSRYLLSGFTGSAGDMLVSPQKAYIFVDGRYHIQVDEQIDNSYIVPVKLQMGESRNDKIKEIIKKSNIKKPKIAFPANKISVENFEVLCKILEKFQPKFIKLNYDPICKFFAINNEQNVYNVWNVGIEIVGKTTSEKLKGLKKYENDFLLVFSNDEVCYLANIRSDQNPYSSSLNCFALVGEGVVRVFCDSCKISEELKFIDEKIIYKDFSEIDNEILKIKKDVFYEASKMPLLYFDKFKDKGIKLRKISQSPVAKMKAIKNKTELAYIQECYQKSDAAILDAIKYLNLNLKKKKKITCAEFMNYLVKAQKKQGIFALSFKPILALNERSAIIHCTEFDSNQQIKQGDLILLDFGVYFEGGYATDMTRTFAAGDKYSNNLLKEVYTTVLKAFLNTCFFPIKSSTTFYDLDKRARSIIKRSKILGFSFNHGTGHGIGLNVHEMPPVLSPSKFACQKIKSGMVFSIEPGMYKEKIGGVRLENSVCTVKTSKGIEIKTLTNLPFDEKLIIFDMLTKKEKHWLKNYQSKVIK